METTITRMTTHLSGDAIVRNPRQLATTTESGNGYAPGSALMTAAGLESLRRELDRLRERTRLEIAQRLREARSYGEGANNDEYHAVREEQMVLEARMASLEDTIARATIVDANDAEQGLAAIGSTIWIEDLASGATAPYRLTSAHQSIGPDEISAASPIGLALLGAESGAVVTVDLPTGRSRSIRLVDVETVASRREEQQAAE
jgi:transcription elongation factor GreA